MLLDCLESRGVVVDLGVFEGVAAGGAGPARVCAEVEAAKLACKSSSRIFSTALPLQRGRQTRVSCNRMKEIPDPSDMLASCMSGWGDKGAGARRGGGGGGGGGGGKH